MYDIKNNKYFKFLDNYYNNSFFDINFNKYLELLLLEEKFLTDFLNIIGMNIDCICNIKIIKDKNVEFIVRFNSFDKYYNIVFQNKINAILDKNSTLYDGVNVFVCLCNYVYNFKNYKCITYQKLYDEVLIKYNSIICMKLIHMLSSPIDDDNMGMIVTNEEINCILNLVNDDFFCFLKSNNFYQNNKRIIHIILNKYLNINRLTEKTLTSINIEDKCNNFLSIMGYYFNGTMHKSVSSFIISLFNYLKKYGYNNLSSLINIYGNKNKLIGTLEECDIFVNLDLFVVFNGVKYYVLGRWFSCDYEDLRFRIKNLCDNKVDYSLLDF